METSRENTVFDAMLRMCCAGTTAEDRARMKERMRACMSMFGAGTSKPGGVDFAEMARCCGERGGKREEKKEPSPTGRGGPDEPVQR